MVIFIILIAVIVGLALKNEEKKSYEGNMVQLNSTNIVSNINDVEKTEPVQENSTDLYGNISYINNSDYNNNFIQEDLQKEGAYFDKNGVNIEVLPESISNIGCKIRITNSGGNPGIWSTFFSIEKNDGENWIEVTPIDDRLLSATPESSVYYYYVQTINWEQKYGVLEPGIYRIRKMQNYTNDSNEPSYYSNEFEIK